MNLAELPWHEPGGALAAQAIVDFLRSIGIDVVVEPIEEHMFLPGLAVDRGRLAIDPAVPSYPGDVLHEAGHIAVLDPEKRDQRNPVTNDGGEEMAAIAWSVAAAKACGVGLDVLFHPAGYKGEAESLAELFEDKQPFGVPLLAYWGLTTAEHYPGMHRWLR